MPSPAYFDTPIFLEVGTKRSKHKKHIRELLKGFQEDRVHVYTSIITVEEVSVAVFQRGSVVRDTYGDVSKIARIYTINKEIALTAAKFEAALKDIFLEQAKKNDPKKRETIQQKVDKICENRRRRWDCFHLATAQYLGCELFFTTDEKLLKRPSQLGLKNLKACKPDAPLASIKGPLFKEPES